MSEHQHAFFVMADYGGEVTVRVNGATIDIHADGSVDTYTGGTVRMHSIAEDGGNAPLRKNQELTPGDVVPDGTIYAGISPDTGKNMFTTPSDAPLTMKWRSAMDYAARLDANGNKDWRVPTKAELNVLWENREKGALKGTFNVTGLYPAGWYCSSAEHDADDVWVQHFSDGNQYWYDKNFDSSLRCVR